MTTTVEGFTALAESHGFPQVHYVESHVIQHAIRRMNMLLIRKGPALNKGNHCLALADRLVE